MRFDFNLDKREEDRAQDIHQSAIIVDGAAMSDSLDYPTDIERMQSGGISTGSFTVASWPENFLRALSRIDKYKQLARQNDDLYLVTSVDDIAKAKEQGKLGVVLAFQDGKPIEDELANLRTFFDVGVRVIQLTYNSQNFIGTGCCEPSYGKLSYFGIKVVKEMNRLGIVIDLSHCGDETTMDAIETSTDPVLFTHASVRALCNAHGRNKTDDQIQALAKKGGVIGICWQSFLTKRDPDTFEVLPCTIEDWLNHIDYVVRLVGVDHVGFGTDLIGKSLDEGTIPWYSSFRFWRPLRPDVFGVGSTEVYDPFPQGLERHSDALNITRGLVARGYSDEEIFKILGGNFLRVFREVWGKQSE